MSASGRHEAVRPAWRFHHVEPVRFPGRGALLTLLMADGAQAAFILTVIPFVLFRSEGLPLAVASSALGIGYGLGIAATLAFGRLADRNDPYVVLQVLQRVQLILLVLASATVWIPSVTVVVVSVVGAIAVLRGVAPVKDRVRALHVPPARRGTFNSQFRRWFLVLGEIAVAAAAVLLTLIPTRLIPLSLLVPAVLVIVSLAATRTLRRAARDGQESYRLRTAHQWERTCATAEMALQDFPR